MTTRKLLLSALLVAALGACADGGDLVEPEQPKVAVPTAYAFESRFQTGASSVEYPGQTVRNLLVQDLKIRIDGLGKPGAQPVTVQAFLALYEHDDAKGLATLTRAGAMALEENRYSSISTGKHLKGKISDAVVIGYGKSADQLLREWFQIVAANSQDPAKLGMPAVYTTAEGVDLGQMVEKLLHGAVGYAQGTGHYLSDGVLFAADNTAAVEGKPFTQMEHFWDEAFGYFGAARDYFGYTDADLASKDAFFKDSNGNGKIDFRSEYNFAFSKNAGKRDKGGQGVDFSKEIFDALLRGRTAIVNQATTAEIAEQRNFAVRGWEKVVAATVVHYINEALADLPGLTSDQVQARNNADLNKHWAEMRGFTIALQYNPFKQISDAQLQEVAQLMGTAPPYAAPGSTASEAAIAGLNKAKKIGRAHV